MAHKKTVPSEGKSTIAVSDYTAVPSESNELQARFSELRDKATCVTAPCTSLSGCPYGKLAFAFPATQDEAKRMGISPHREPLICNETGKHCPWFYLRDKRQFDPTTQCWDLEIQPSCYTCQVGPHVCPRGQAWVREVAVTRDKISCREAEVESLMADGQTEDELEFMIWHLNELYASVGSVYKPVNQSSDESSAQEARS